MKIFQVVPYYPPHIGGMEFYVQRLSQDLAARGHDVTVFTSSNFVSQSIRSVKGVRICSLQLMTKVYNVPIVPTLLWRLLSSEKPDIVHTHQYPIFFSDIAAAYCWIKKVPLINHVHVVSDANSPLSSVISDVYYSSLGLSTLSNANLVIVPSFAYKAKLSKMYINPNKIRVVPYGIDVKKFQNAKGEAFKKKFGCEYSRIILSVGRLNYQKGFHNLIQVMPSIIKQVPDAKLVIAGDGELLMYLKTLAKSLAITESVIFTGGLSQTEISQAYAACDVFVLPSMFESFGISLIEAQAAGKPVIGTRTGGVPEALIDGETGFVVEANELKQLKMAILSILVDSKLSKNMGMKGQEFVERNFDGQAVIVKILKIYEALLSEYKSIKKN